MNKDEIYQEAKNYVEAFKKEIAEEIKKGVYFETGEGINIQPSEE